MSLVIKSDLVITNPQLGKLITKKIITSGTLIKSVFGNIVGTQTDAVFGGVPASWTGAAVAEYIATGLANSINNVAGTVYLNHSEIKNFSVSFEAVEVTDGELIIDLRRKTVDNYCVRAFLVQNKIYIHSRAGDTLTVISDKSLQAGDKVEFKLIGNNVTLKINDSTYDGVIPASHQSGLNRNGVLALSKGSSVGRTGRVVIKNLIVSELR